MRPLTLKMTAFGPYADTVYLDFNDLQTHSLFLITGPTGSGKTTILDAMVYALFGESSGGLRSGTTMRSDYATPTVPTEVVFTFSVGDKDYKMERSPKQQVKKKRGEGFREQGAQARLSIWQGDAWVEFSTRAQDIKEKVHDILGFRAEQFLQVVLLPQGEFRKLLVAPTSEREDLMHSLFRTEIYSRLQAVLKDEYEAVSAEAKEVINRQRYLLSSEQVVTGNELRERLAAQTEIVRQKDELVATKLQEQTAVIKAYDLGQQRHALEQQIARHQAELEILTEQKPQISAKKTLLAQIMEYEPISRYKATWQSLVAKEVAVQAAYEESVQIQDKLKKEADCLGETKAVLAKDMSTQADYQLTLHKAEQINTQFEKIDVLQSEIAQLVQQVSEQDKIVKKQETIVAEGKEKVSLLKSSVIAIRQQLTMQHEIARQREAVKEGLQIGKKALEAMTTCQTNTGLLSVKRRAYELAVQSEEIAKLEREHQVRLQAQYQAATLALTLESDVPCPVCGSKEHPQLATMPVDLVKGRVEEAELAHNEALQKTSVAKTELSQATADLTIAEQAVEEAEAAIATWLQTYSVSGINGGTSSEFVAEVEVQLQVLDQQWQQLLHKEAEVQRLAIEQAAVEDRLQEQQERWQLLDKESQTLSADLGRKEEALSLLQSEVASIDRSTWLDELTSKKAWLAAYEKKKQTYEVAYTKHVEAVSANETTLQSLRTQREELATNIREAKTTYETALAQSKLTEADILAIETFTGDVKGLTDEVRKYEDAWGQREALLKAAKQELASVPEVTCLVSDEDKEAVMAAYETALREAAIQSKEEQRLQAVLTEYETLVTQNETITERRTFIFNLYDLANGGDSGLKGVTFERYVLGAILEEVVVAANNRLRYMSRGRYTLERADLNSVRRGHRGLDLAVLDTYTGYARPANTLSGGETFLASLSLAMGLADVIQAYAGGIHLDTIFIDEGFGTLDPDTLDVAMETLVELQESGRLVGIISHVPELKTRIPAHLEVKSTERGSDAHFVIL